MALTLALTLALSAAAQADTDCNVKIREGKLTKLEISSEVELAPGRDSLAHLTASRQLISIIVWFEQ